MTNKQHKRSDGCSWSDKNLQVAWFLIRKSIAIAITWGCCTSWGSSPDGTMGFGRAHRKWSTISYNANINLRSEPLWTWLKHAETWSNWLTRSHIGGELWTMEHHKAQKHKVDFVDLLISNLWATPIEHVRWNPDVAPRLTSGGYEDKVDVITPINILFIGDGEFWSLMKIKLMLLPQSTYCS